MIKFSAKFVALVVLALTLSLATGCSSKEEPASTAVRSGEVEVLMKNIKYSPAKFTVKAGTRITFVNKDAMVHDVVQVALKELGKAEPGFDSGVIDAAKSWSIVMDKPGTYPILCSQSGHFTAGMVGSITVVE